MVPIITLPGLSVERLGEFYKYQAGMSREKWGQRIFLDFGAWKIEKKAVWRRLSL
jgi:hypothetical protein